MLSVVKSILRGLGIDTRSLYQSVCARSITAAVREQGYEDRIAKLREAVPEIADQYTASYDADAFKRYWDVKLRGQHAFQVDCALRAIDRIGGTSLTIVDIGDSAGTHAAYIRAMTAPGTVGRFVSVNLDPVAVDKIKAKGGEAVLCRAEELHTLGIRPDFMISFETLEHMIDPIGFLRSLAVAETGTHLLVTVPYRRQGDGRFGGYHLRRAAADADTVLNPEVTHIHEFELEDWCLMARFAGWRAVEKTVYRQYPRRGFWLLTAPMWRRLDFEGYAGILLERDLTLSNLYSGW